MIRWTAGLRRRALACTSLLVVCSSGAAGATERSTEVMLRVRVEPSLGEPVRLFYRLGGEGFGGAVVSGELTTLPDDPNALKGWGHAGTDYFPAPGKPAGRAWIRPGAWSPELPLSTFDTKGRPPFVTFTADGMKAGAKSASLLRNLVFDVQLRYRGQTLKTLRVKAPDGPTATIRLPFGALSPAGTPSPAFLEGAVGLSEYAHRRLRFLESLPWASRPAPRRLGIVSDLYGYAPGAGYAIRTTDKDVVLTELKAARQLGINGLRNTPVFVSDMLKNKEGVAAQFSRIRIGYGIGYGVPWAVKTNPASGCPYHPSVAGQSERVKAQVADLLARLSPSTEEAWFLEGDEIGSVFDGAVESKAHQSVCPYCQEAFRKYLKDAGLGLADFGAKSWADIRSTYGYWDQSHTEDSAAAPAAKKVDGYKLETGALDQKPPPAAPQPGFPAGPPPMTHGDAKAPLSEEGWALLYYHSRKFNADSSAMLLEPQREFFDEANAAKRSAIAAGRLDAPEAQRPWVYTYALRGVNFLIGGHSLDLFDFYRRADTGFMYETSNRDPRAWPWDSYVCDIGRMLSTHMQKRFGVYVKPHRGAVIQRALSAVARNAKVLFWYTYGPDWVKADSFSESNDALSDVSRGARLLAAAEDTLYDAEWASPAEIAVVRPRTSEFFENNASWENGKWIYTALQHRHLPVDPIDEGMLETEDLSRYRVIYVSGSHLRKAAAARLAGWVRAGGVLYTSGWGLARDEANQPLKEMDPVLGLASRGTIEFWNDVRRYGATALPEFAYVQDRPPHANVTGNGPFAGSFDLTIGREVLVPSPGTEVLAKYGDGAAAITRHAYGNGAAYVAGFYSGVEYSADVTKAQYDMSRDFNPTKASFIGAAASLAGVSPVVDASSPLVEGILVKNTRTGRFAVALMNWAYRTRECPPDGPARHCGASELVSGNGMTIRVSRVGHVKRVVSAWSTRPVPFVQQGDAITVTLPKLGEADVLLLE